MCLTAAQSLVQAVGGTFPSRARMALTPYHWHFVFDTQKFQVRVLQIGLYYHLHSFHNRCPNIVIQTPVKI